MRQICYLGLLSGEHKAQGGVAGVIQRGGIVRIMLDYKQCSVHLCYVRKNKGRVFMFMFLF